MLVENDPDLGQSIVLLWEPEVIVTFYPDGVELVSMQGPPQEWEFGDEESFDVIKKVLGRANDTIYSQKKTT